MGAARLPADETAMLWRARDLEGYAIGVAAGQIGRVVDVRFDDGRWAVRSIVVDVGRPVLLRPWSIEHIDPTRRVMLTGLATAELVNSPNVDTDGCGHSAWEVTTHYVQGLDAEIGRVADVVVDARSWTISHLVVSADDGLTERQVLLPVGWISWLSSGARTVVVPLRGHAVHTAPLCDYGTAIDPDDEIRVAAHYGRPPFRSR